MIKHYWIAEIGLICEDDNPAKVIEEEINRAMGDTAFLAGVVYVTAKEADIRMTEVTRA